MRHMVLTIRKALIATALGVLVLAMSATPLQAQFSGPAPTVGPQGITTPTTDPALLNPATQDIVLTAGDVVTVRLFGSIDFNPVVRVATDGTIQLPLIGQVPVAGLTVDRAENLIAQRLLDGGFYVNPQVTLQVTESVGQFATVAGEMHAIIPLAGSRRLFDVLAAAGSLPITASHVITILRQGVADPIIVDLGTDPARSQQANIPILPRDTILISRVGVVYVIGAFAKQGIIPLDQNAPLTLMQATAISGGTGFEGRYEDLRIIRTVGLERKLVTTNIKKVLNGKAPDPVLQANDIVFLPSNALKAALKAGGIGTVSNIASLLIIAFQPR